MSFGFNFSFFNPQLFSYLHQESQYQPKYFLAITYQNNIAAGLAAILAIHLK